MLNDSEWLPPHSVKSSYCEEETNFMKTVREVSFNQVTKVSNIITSHVIYKVKANDDGSLKINARIVPHVNKVKDRDLLKTDSAQCLHTGIRIPASIATIMKRQLAKIDFVSAFLKLETRKEMYM